MTEYRYTRFTNNQGPLTKTYSCDTVTGSCTEDSSSPRSHLYDGSFDVMVVSSLDELAEAIRDIEKNQAHTYSLPKIHTESHVTSGTITTQNSPTINPEVAIIPRTKEYFDFPERPGILFIDIDNGDPEDVAIGKLAELHASFGETSYLYTTSTSHGINGKRGFHLYFLVDDVSLVIPVMNNLCTNPFYDTAPYTKVALDYISGPLCLNFEAPPRTIRTEVREKGTLDLGLLRDVVIEEGERESGADEHGTGLAEGPSGGSSSHGITQSNSKLSTYLRNIDPGLARSDWIKVLSVAKSSFKDGPEDNCQTAKYWSALSSKFPGEGKFMRDWDSLDPHATPASLISLAQKYPPGYRSILPFVSYADLGLAKELSEKLFNNCRERLEGYGNTLTEPEEKALQISAEVVVFSLFSEDRGRISIPLPTGFGKSSLIRSLIWLLKEEDVDKNLLVCVSRHVEIKENIQSLSGMGISGDTVGVFMSPDYQSDWDSPREDLAEKQTVFVSHARINQGGGYRELEYLTEVNGIKRLILWDESAQTAHGVYLNADKVSEQVSGLLERMDGVREPRSEGDEKMYQWLAGIRRKMSREIYGRFTLGDVWLPSDFQRRYSLAEELGGFINFAGNDLAWTKFNIRDKLLIKFEVRIPDELSCLIFDASAQVSSLIGYDRSISHCPVHLERDYSRCYLDCVNLKSSKSHLGKRDNILEQINILKEWITEKGIANEELLVITKIPFQNNRNMLFDIPQILKEKIPGVKVLTWGSERGVNKYRDVKYTANIGMNWRDPKNLHADALALSRDLDRLVLTSKVEQIQHDEFLSEVQQWIPRTRMRFSQEGQAKEVHVLFIHDSATRLAHELERKIFPGLNIKLYKETLADTEHQRELYAQTVCDFLRNYQGDSVSVVKLKKATNMGELSSERWNTITSRVKEYMLIFWEHKGRSWYKITR